MSENDENRENSDNSQSSNVQIDDVLQGNFNVNTQGELFTINAGGASLTGHEVACILDYLEKNYHKMFGHNRDAEYGSKKKKKWKKLVKLVNRVHGYERNEDQI